MRKRSRAVSLLKHQERKGKGLLNTIINKLPFELHIPTYNWCGPGTNVTKRLRRGDKGINLLDEACKVHDISYQESNDLSKRHLADEKLYERAVERIKSKDAGFGEKLAATTIATIMKGKTKLGMGMKRGKKKSSKKVGTRKHKSTYSGGTMSFLDAMKRARKVSGRKISKRKRQKKSEVSYLGGAMSFMEAMRRARRAMGRAAVRKSILDNVRVAYRSLKKPKHRRIIFPKSRVIPLPKRGGFLPLIPLFAALGALGSLSGGAAAIVKAVNDAKAAKDQLMEAQRHNVAMEHKLEGSGLYVKPYKPGCGIHIGGGMYVKPYKSGCGLYLSRLNVSKNG